VIVETWALTDVGKQRIANEDCHYVDPDKELVLVLDGMGGHQAGEVASNLAMETISEFYKGHSDVASEDSDLFENYDTHFTLHANLLRQAVFMANRVVLERSREDDSLVGMGSTVAAMAIHDYTVSLANVGDSRLYMFRDGTMELVSRDHTLAEDQVERGIMTPREARESQLRHILSSVVGVDTRVRVHMDELTVFPGDAFLLCTDGLTAVMEDEEIFTEVTETGFGQEALRRMIDETNARGGPDNVTLALVVFNEDPDEL
jgi:PPM family protein phosphatase